MYSCEILKLVEHSITSLLYKTNIQLHENLKHQLTARLSPGHSGPAKDPCDVDVRLKDLVTFWTS